jgi:hypothetical protein
MITQDNPEFKQDLKFLVDATIQLYGWTKYVIRTEVFDPRDPYGAGHISCGRCDKQIDIRHDCVMRDTGYVKYLDTITKTPCCGRDVDPRLCPLVCVPCQRIALFMTPHTNDRRFEFIAGRVYHLDRCTECCVTPEFKSLILEQVVFDRLNKTHP